MKKAVNKKKSSIFIIIEKVNFYRTVYAGRMIIIQPCVHWLFILKTLAFYVVQIYNDNLNLFRLDSISNSDNSCLVQKYFDRKSRCVLIKNIYLVRIQKPCNTMIQTLIIWDKTKKENLKDSWSVALPWSSSVCCFLHLVCPSLVWIILSSITVLRRWTMQYCRELMSYTVNKTEREK